MSGGAVPETPQTKSARERLGSTFDRASDLYQRARPEYPAEVFERLIRIAGLRFGDHLLEVGCATGKATLPLAERGFRITCIEAGEQLAAAGRRNLAAFPGVDVVAGRFEDWPNPPLRPCLCSDRLALARSCCAL
ncbi:methyltransferase domain-containing protein [Candidatus Dormiibacter inghamiae]|uniref:class I SAM-dependent methyltransferase n=1 Tax=Candidatus Dormiibacter inghamiae TaxID=3127013 RepID=UPI003312FA6F